MSFFGFIILKIIIFRFRLICAQLTKCEELAHQKQEYLSCVEQLIQLNSAVESQVSQAGTSLSGQDTSEIQPLVLF